MKHIIKSSIIGVISIIGSISVVCHSETLEQIYRLALENDHTLKAAKARFAADKEAKNLALAGLLPSLNGSYQWSDSSTETSGTNFDVDSQTFNIFDGIEQNDETRGFSIGLEQPIIDFAAWSDFKAGSYSGKIASLEYARAQQSLIIRSATAYLNVLEAYDSLQTALAEEKAFKQQLEQSKKRFEVGLTAITEVHESQAAYDSSVAGRLSAEGLYTIAFENLEVLTGKQISVLAPLDDNFPVVLPDPLDRQQWVDYSMENNLPLKIFLLLKKNARATANARRADHYPTVTGNIRYSDTTSDSENQDAQGSLVRGSLESTNTSFGITVNIPIYNGGAVSSSRRRANRLFIEASENYSQAQRDLVQEARSVHLNVVTGVATVKARKQATVSNKSALDATQSGYEVGTRDLVDVLNAQRNLFAAQRDYQEALYDYILFTLAQKEVAGTLNDKHIAELNQWLDTDKTIHYSF